MDVEHMVVQDHMANSAKISKKHTKEYVSLKVYVQSLWVV